MLGRSSTAVLTDDCCVDECKSKSSLPCGTGDIAFFARYHREFGSHSRPMAPRALVIKYSNLYGPQLAVEVMENWYKIFSVRPVT